MKRKPASLSVVALVSGFFSLAYELIYQKALSLINGDLYLTYALIVLTFIIAMAAGNLWSHRGRGKLPQLILGSGFYALGFATFLRFGGYQLILPTPILIITLAIPAFLAGTQIPLFAYYLKHLSFTITYILYHLGAVAGLVLLELAILPAAPLSWSFAGLGLAQVLIGGYLWQQQHQGVLVSQVVTFSRVKLKSFISTHRQLLLAVLLISTISYYYHFSIMRILYYFEFLTRSVNSWFLITAIVMVTIGSIVAYYWKRLSLAKVTLIFITHALATIILLPQFASQLMHFPLGAFDLYLAILNAFAFAPLLWASTFFCLALKYSSPPDKQTDIHAGIFLAVSAVGNLCGFLIATQTNSLLKSWWWAIPMLCLGSVALLVLTKTNFKRLAGMVILAVVVGFFGCHYQLAPILETGLTTRNVVRNKIQHPGSSNYISPTYKFSQLSADFSTIVGVLEQTNPTLEATPEPTYVLGGYISHKLNTFSETKVGLIPRRYFANTPNQALVIGVGTGQTTLGVSMIADHTTAVDIDPGVLAFLPRLNDYNQNLLQNPQVEIVAADGMTYLKNQPTTYQVILNTATNLFTHGVAKLSTKEFYQLAKKRLTDDGIYVSWVDSASLNSLPDLHRVLSAQLTYFNHLDIHLLGSGYLLLVAYDQDRLIKELQESDFSPGDWKYLSDNRVELPNLPLATHLEKYAYLTGDRGKYSTPTMDYPAIEQMALKNYLSHGEHQHLDFREVLPFGNDSQASSSDGGRLINY